jgi:hypothetical protein
MGGTIMNWVYIDSDGCYTVGFYGPDGTWNAASDHKTRKEAEKQVHYLNGGSDTLLSDDIRNSIAELAKYLFKDEKQDYEDHKEEREKAIVEWLERARTKDGYG